MDVKEFAEKLADNLESLGQDVSDSAEARILYRIAGAIRDTVEQLEEGK